MTRPTIAEVEAAGYATWSPDEETSIGGWTVRANGGFTRRVNSATAVGDPDTSPETRDAITSWLRKHGAELAIRVTPMMGASTVERCASEWGLEALDDTAVLIREVDPDVEPHSTVHLVGTRHTDFTEDLVRLNDRPVAGGEAWNRILDRIGSQGAGVWMPGSAAGIVAVHDRIGVVYSVAVERTQRRRGFGARIMQASTAWARRQGAEWIALQVLGTNDEALGLYEALQFEELYRYSYLQPPSADDIGC